MSCATPSSPRWSGRWPKRDGSPTCARRATYCWPPDRARGDADEALEGAAECGLGAVAEPVGELGDGGALVLQRGDGEVHAPAGQEAHRGFADEFGEAGGEGRARHGQLVGERGDGPVAGGVAVDE